MATTRKSKSAAAPVRAASSTRVTRPKKAANDGFAGARRLVADVTNAVMKPTTTAITYPTDWGKQIDFAVKVRNSDAASIIDFMVSSANSGVQILAKSDIELLVDEVHKAIDSLGDDGTGAGGKGVAKRRGPKTTRTKIDAKNQELKEACDFWAENVNRDILGEEPGLDRLNETFYEEIWGGSNLWLGQYALVPTFVPALNRKVNLPMNVVVHNPKMVQIDFGTTFAERTITLGGTSAAITIRTDKQSNVTTQALKGKGGVETIKANFILQTGANKPMYYRMPTPYLMRVVEPYEMKRSLYESDYDVLTNLLKALLIFKEGVPGEGVEREELEKMAEYIRSIMDNITTQTTRYMAGSPNFEAKWITPPTDTLLSAQKYFQSSVEFLSRLGILVQPQMSESNGAFKVTSISPLIANIEAGRVKCRRMNERFMAVIRDANKEFADLRTPNVRQMRMKNLEDPQKIKLMVQNVFDRGLPWQFLLDEYGYDMGDVLRGAAWEKINGLRDILTVRPTYAQQSDGRPTKGENPNPDQPDTKINKPSETGDDKVTEV